MNAAYIHIPFCEHICHYCDFNKVFLQNQPVDEYVDLLIKEMAIVRQQHPDSQFKTIFVGGGTPTALDEKQLAVLCEGIRTYLPFEDGEFTFEANPGDLSLAKLKVLADYGVNRLSFGVQAFDDELLQRIGRAHRVKDVYTSISNAQEAGFSNISIDLIYALPGQTTESFKHTLDSAIALNLPHYSGYSLIVEPKTVFYNQMRNGKLKLPGEDAETTMYGMLMEEMAKHGLEQYEISNFAKKGYESRHNLVYWSNEEYFGFGAGAHGYAGDTRYSNYGPLKKYMEPLREGERPLYETFQLTKREKMEEEMFLGLRKTAGVSTVHFKQKFAEEMRDVFSEPIQEMTERGLLEIKDGAVRLTEKGRYLGNEVFQAFLL